MAGVGLAGAFPEERVAYAQGDDNDYVDVGLTLEVRDQASVLASLVELDIIVVNHGSRTAYDVEVVVNIVYPEDSSHFDRVPRVVPVGVASLDNNERTLRWSIPSLGELQREQVVAYVRKISSSAPAFDYRNDPHEYFGRVTTSSFQSNRHKGNDTARVWSYRTALNQDQYNQAGGNYSVLVSVDEVSPSPGDAVNFTITAKSENPSGRTGLISPPIDLKVDIELTGGLSVSGDPTYPDPFPGYTKPASVSYSNGVFNIGTLKAGDSADNLVTLPITVASNSGGTQQCLTATLTGNPPPGGGRYDDDISDNVAKVCLGPAPAGEQVVLDDGEVSAVTLYPCVGIETYPCDSTDDVRVRAIAKAGIVGSGRAVFHVPDHPLARAFDSHAGSVNAGTAVSWQTSCNEGSASCTGFNPDRSEFGVKIGWNRIPFNGHWRITGPPAEGTWEGISVNATARGKDAGTDPPGTMHIRFDGGASFLTLNNGNGWSHTQFGSSPWNPGGDATSINYRVFEFEKLGTYVLNYTIRAKHFSKTGDCDTEIDADSDPDSFCGTETYIFHVGPLQDLEVSGTSGASAGQTTLTIRAANNGPENSADATVKIVLPPGALVEDYVASDGTYANGVWTLPGLKMRDYRRSQGKPEAATLTLILKEGGGIPQELATATISLTDNSYNVCIDSKRNTLAHETQADCKADAKTTDTWHSAVCVQDSDQTVNTSATHDTQAECEALTGHTWTANVCANDDGKVIAGYTEPECDGWHTGTVYDPPANNKAKITAVKGTGGIGPDIPANVTTQTGATTVTWDDVDYLYGLPVARYQLQWLGGDWTMLADAVIENEFVDDAPSGRRAYRVRAVNAAGYAGPWSRSSVQAALGSPGPPQNVSARADGNNAIDVSWASPEDTGNSPVTGYRVEWSADPEQGRWSGANTPELTYKHRNLQTAATWHYRVAARNRGGLGVWSDPVMGTTAPTAPDAPGNFRATTLSDYEIELTWNEPKDNGEPITGYQLERSRDGSADSWSQRATPGADATAYTDSTLDANTRYYYRVRAVNSVGAGAWSRSVSTMTQLTPPDAPSLTSVEADGPNAIIVSWEEPWYLGDLPITQYQVQWAKDPYSEIWRGPQTLSGSTRSWRHTGLKPDETWHYQVRASNGGGRWSVWSYSSAATTASDNAPKAVSGFRAQYDKDDRQVNLTWNDLSGSETTFSYELEHSEDGGDWRELTTVSSSSCEAGKCAYGDTDVWPGARLSYRIRASIDGDAGPWSSTQSVSVPADPPDAPRYRWVEADGSNHIYYEWEPPYYDGGAPITGYRLLWCRALDGADENPCEDAMEESNSPADPPGYSRISVGASARSYTHSVSPGYNYYYLVRATNGGNRWSEWEEYDITGYVRTYAGVPAAPSLTARAVDANQIRLTWSRPSSSGSEISEYWLYIYENGEDLYDWDNILDILRVPGDRTEWTVGDLSPETTRYFRIRALNDNGEGKYSALRQATTPSG